MREQPIATSRVSELTSISSLSETRRMVSNPQELGRFGGYVARLLEKLHADLNP